VKRPSHFFRKKFSAIAAAPSVTALYERTASKDSSSPVRFYLIQTTRPVAFLTHGFRGPAIYLSKTLISDCTDEQLQTVISKLALELKKNPFKIWMGTFFIGLGWRFENLSLARFEGEGFASGSPIGFFSFLKMLLLLPAWRLGWNLSRTNRQWIGSPLSLNT